MKIYKSLVIMMALVLVLSVLPALVVATDVGSGITPVIETEDFEPRVWLCDDRVVLDDNVEPGRLCAINPNNGDPMDPNYDTPSQYGKEFCEWDQDVSSYEVEGVYLHERLGNYAFEGEQIVWDVVVFDKNGIEKIQDVFATVGTSQGSGNDIEVNCILDEVIQDPNNNQRGSNSISEHNSDSYGDGQVWEECNARIGEEYLKEFKDNTAAKYKCIFTVETPDSMYGEHWLTVEAVDLDGLSGTMDENEYWFLNPTIALTIDGALEFENVRPGSSAYSNTLLVGNDADDGSGVLLDMFISGTDFYDSSSSGAKCPLTNQLKLGDGKSDCQVCRYDFDGTDSCDEGEDFSDAFCYFASNGAYSSQNDLRNDGVEDYVGINYGIGFNNPNPFYGAFNGDATGYEIIQSPNTLFGSYFAGNVLTPGGEMAITFRLNLPEPCNGDFDTGSIYFWGEAI
jgi:hypothetical protein